MGKLVVYGVAFLVGALLPSLILSPWTWRSLDFWVEHVKGGPVETSWGVAWLCSLLFPLAFLANIVSEVARLFV